MSVQALSWAMAQRTIEPLEKLLLIFLADRADMDNVSNLEGVHEFSCASIPAVRKAMVGLAKLGLIQHDGATLRVLCPTENRTPSVGDVPERLRKELIAEAGFACVACGSSERLCIDHIMPRRRGGTNDRANLQVLCAPCNTSKGSKLPEQWAGRPQ